VGGPAYVASLTDGVPRSANVEYYARIVKEKSTLRRLIQSATEVLTRAYDAEEGADDLLDEAERSIFQIAEHRTAIRIHSAQPTGEHRLRADRKAAGAQGPRHRRAERASWISTK
jgi:replicative DNA helicase